MKGISIHKHIGDEIATVAGSSAEHAPNLRRKRLAPDFPYGF